MLYFLTFQMFLGLANLINLIHCQVNKKQFNVARLGYITIGLIAFYFFMAKGY